MESKVCGFSMCKSLFVFCMRVSGCVCIHKRPWTHSHYDAVQTVTFMGSISLKADRVIKPSATC